MVNEKIKALFEEEHILRVSVLPLSACRVTNARLYEQKGFLPQSVLVFLIPYFSVAPDNFSAYAAAEDYHFYAKELYARMHTRLKEAFPEGDFLGFADHSPIDERDAAIRAGLRAYIPETTKLIIAQRVSSVMEADMIILLENGRIAARGTHEELLASSDHYRELCEQQMGGAADEE